MSELPRSQARHFGDETFRVSGPPSWTFTAAFDEVSKLARVLVELIACRGANLAACKAPRRVVFGHALSLGPTGRFLKAALRETLAREL